MKILIAYYSRTKNTEKLAGTIKKELEERGHMVDVEKVQPVREHSFLGWWNLRIIKGQSDIRPPKIKNVSKYNVICIGSPNWTRLSLPVAGYLQDIQGLRGKNVALFSTTASIPILEWYFFSAYLLDFTFSKIIKKKGGRIIDSLLLSSFFKGWSVDSGYGQKVIKDFCTRIETSIPSLKEYSLLQNDIENNRLLVTIFSVFLILLLFFQFFLYFSGKQFLTWEQYLFIFLLGLFNFFAIISLLAGRIWLFLGKYLAGISLIVGFTTLVLISSPDVGRIFIAGYILIFIILGFFRNLKTVLFMGITAILSYFFLFFYFSQKDLFILPLDLSIIFLSILLVGIVAKKLQKNYDDFLEIQDDLEMISGALEIKVDARTRELRELAKNLDAEIKNKTRALQEKIIDLERFNKLAVGREMRMIELKKEITELKKKMEKNS